MLKTRIGPYMLRLIQLFAVEFSIQEEDEQVDVDLRSAEHFHHGDSLVLQLEQILSTDQQGRKMWLGPAET